MLTLKQREQRKKGIGGSDAAAVCGVSQWKTPFDVYLDKTREDRLDDPTAAMIRGSILEPFIFDHLRECYGIQAETSEETLIHPDYPYILANVDGFIDNRTKILEIKTSTHFNAWGDSYTDQIPDEYLAQVHHYMNVTGTEETLVAVLLGTREYLSLLAKFVEHRGYHEIMDDHGDDLDLDLRFYTIKRNPGLADAILYKEKTFWTEHVLKGVEPPAQTMDDLKKLFPNPTRHQIHADDAAQKLIDAIKERDARIKEIEAENDRARKALAEKIGAYSMLISQQGDILATWKSQTRRTLDTKALHLAMPHIYNQFSVEKPIRILKVR